MKYLTCWALIVLCLPVSSLRASEFDHRHQALTQVLQKVVKASENRLQSRVDYQTLAQSPATLNDYLEQLSAVTADQYQSWDQDQKLAFLINAYNAFTLDLIVRHYRQFQRGEAGSIRDLGTWLTSPWEKRFIPLLGQRLSLDQIEHDRIRQDFHRPRIHAALVCAAVSCPPLLATAYQATKLTAQLDNQMHRFLADDSRNRLKDNVLWLSSIFDWYGEDFNGAPFNGLRGLVKQYASAIANNPSELDRLTQGHYSIDFLDYNWQLNDTPFD